MLSPLTLIGEGISVAVGNTSGAVVETTTVGKSVVGAGSVAGGSWTGSQAERKTLRISRKLISSRDVLRFCMCLLYPLFRQVISGCLLQ